MNSKLFDVTPMIIIHREHCRDIDTIDEIFDEISSTYPKFRDWFRDTCVDRDCIVARTQSKQIVGILIYAKKTLRTLPQDYCKLGYQDHMYKICTFMVHKDYRNGHMSYALYQAFRNEVNRDDWIEYVSIYDEKLPATVKFFESLGFERFTSKKRTGETYFINEVSPKFYHRITVEISVTLPQEA